MRRVLGYSYVGDTNYAINNTGTFLIATADTTPTAATPTFGANTRAGIHLAAGQEFNASIPVATRAVVAADIGKILVLKSTRNPTYNSGCFLITEIDAGTNSYVLDYKSGAYMGGTTIVQGASNGQILPQGTITVASTTGFPTSGSILIVTTAGRQTVAYTGTTGTSFTGCTGGTGTMNTGNTVLASTFITLPTATITVSSTTGFSSSGTFFTYSSAGRQTITYTGITATTFTGCTGGTGTVRGGAFIVQTTNTTVAAGSNGVTFANTTISSLSNGATLPQGTINVASTTGFPASGTISVVSSNGVQAVTYTGTTGTTFTGCTGGTGTLLTGNAVAFPTLINVASTTTATTTIAAASNNVPLPTATINVASTTGFPTVGSIYVTTNQGINLVTYTGTTSTTFTGCTGGFGYMATGGSVIAGFSPTGGIIYVASSTGIQQINYTATTSTTFTGCLNTGSGSMTTGNVVYYSPSVPRIEPFDSMNWYLYEKDAVVSNLAQGASNGNTNVQYRGNGSSTTPRIILQSPHPSGWQIRVCHETTNDSGVGTSPISSECALISFAPGFGGNSSGDFAVGGPHLHAPLYFNSNSNNLQGGASGFGDPLNIPTSTVTSLTYRITITGDDDGYGVSIFGRRPGNGISPRSYFVTFGRCDSEATPLPPNPEARLFIIGSGNSQNSGNNLNDLTWVPGNITGGTPTTQGITMSPAEGSYAIPSSVCVSFLGYAIGNGAQGSPIFDGTAGDTPWFGGVELFAIDLISGTFNTWNGSSLQNFGFPLTQGRFLGSIPHIREGRANYTEYSTTADLVGQHMRRGLWMLWDGPPVIT